MMRARVLYNILCNIVLLQREFRPNVIWGRGQRERLFLFGMGREGKGGRKLKSLSRIKTLDPKDNEKVLFFFVFGID